MKTICVIGDSWAGNVPYSQGIFSHIFEPAGFSVINISAGGASNQGQLRKLETKCLSEDTTIDHVIWIYTEPARDFTEFVSLDYGDDTNARATSYPELTLTDFYYDLEYMQLRDFDQAERLCNLYSLRFIVIGGAGRLPENCHSQKHMSLLSHSWNQEICGLEHMPWNCYPHHVAKMADFGRYNRGQVLEELEKINRLETFMKNRRDLYSDGMHPSLHLYPLLGERIISHLKDAHP